MNGRMYDPVVGRFLNADPVIQDPGHTESYNRYSYCLNNPLKYADPSGNIAYTYWQDDRSGYDGAPFNVDFSFSRHSGGGAGGGSVGTYSYNWNSGTYSDGWGNDVSYSEVHNNYIIPNSTSRGGHGSSYYHSDGPSGGITSDKGGFINNEDVFLNFMYDKAENYPDEVSGFKLDDGKFFVEPWDKNGPEYSITRIDGVPGYNRMNISAQYHTHPNSSGPSIFDAQFSAAYGKPVYTLGANGNMWKVSYLIGQRVPIYGRIENGKYYGFPYGTKIK